MRHESTSRSEAGFLIPAISGDFSVSDLVRAAAERAVTISHVARPDSRIDTPAMSGTVFGEELQPGLLLTAYDLVYTADSQIEVEVDRSISCAIMLAGEAAALEVVGYPPVVSLPRRVIVVGYGDRLSCSRPWRAMQHNRAFGVTLRPCFFDRFADLVDDGGLDVLRSYLDPGLHSSLLPPSRKLIDLAENTLRQPYSGALGAIHREAQALGFILEAASMLQEEQRLVARIGRRHYDRVVHARAMLDHNLVDPPKLLELARELGINVTTLQANFKAAFGTTVFGYLRARRLEMGRILIVEHRVGVAEAGYRVGFTNPAAFTAAYRRHFGLPPSLDRKDAHILPH